MGLTAKQAALLLTLTLLLPVLPLWPQDGAAADAVGASSGIPGDDQAALDARENFRVGTQAYYRYGFNEAILSFEKALSFRPGEALILDWLGRAYYRSGLDDIALREWQYARDAYGARQRQGFNSAESLLLSSKIETLRNRRSLLAQGGNYPLEEAGRYVEAGHFPGRYNDIISFRQPSAVMALEDGSVWVVAYGSNEILQIDVNGLIKRRQRGPINGFDRPYDMVRGGDGRLFVSELRGGRISVLDETGSWLSYIGKKGLGPGELMGPANLALDEEGYLYVVEYGNRRISKFDPSGTFIVNFGSQSEDFPGFLSPTGIAVGWDRVFVADSLAKCVYAFDRNGRYLGVLSDEGLNAPEGMRFLSDGSLLLCDSRRLLRLDIESSLVTELGKLPNARCRIIGADRDRNGNLIAANFDNDEVLILSGIDDIAAGLFVQIDRVISDSFPTVQVELSVQDRSRRPIVGLDERNFLLSEGGQAVAQQNFLFAGYRSPDTGVAVMVERSPESFRSQEDLSRSLRDIEASVGSITTLVSCGEMPVLEDLGNHSPTDLERAGRGKNSSYSPRWRFDLGLRLAATGLLRGPKKRAVVYTGPGVLGELAFETYSLSELASYLANNGIVFHGVITGGGQGGEELRYLARETGGTVMSLYRPQGVGPVLSRLRDIPSGVYILSYQSRLYTDFGRAYLPVEAEVYLLERSGRDATGYFPPME